MEMPEIPKESVGDQVHKLMRSALGAIPFAGAAAIELFNTIIIPPINKKRDEFMYTVMRNLLELNKNVKVVNIEALCENDLFVSTLMHSLRIAMQTHQKEKLELLKNVVVNTTLNVFEEEDEYAYYLHILEDLSVKELQALKLLEKYQVKIPEGFLTNLSGCAEYPMEIIDRLNNLWELYELELNEQLKVPKEEIEWFIKRLTRMGLFTSSYGDYNGTLAGKGTLTDLYKKLKKLITLDLFK